MHGYEASIERFGNSCVVRAEIRMPDRLAAEESGSSIADNRVHSRSADSLSAADRKLGYLEKGACGIVVPDVV